MSQSLEDFLGNQRRNFPAEGHIVSITTSDFWDHKDDPPAPVLHVGVWETDHALCRLGDVEFALSRNKVMILQQALTMALEQMDD